MAILIHCLMTACLLLEGAAAATASQKSELQTRIQQALDMMVAEIEEHYFYWHANLSMQVGWRSNDDFFTVAAGTTVETPSIAKHQVTENDTFLFGSGTKPFVAAAVFRLIEQGKILPQEPVHTYIDPFLQANNGTTLAGIFGEEIKKATALDLIRMTAGIPDFEVGSFDNVVLLQKGDQVVPVYENIHYAANYQNINSNPCLTVADCNCQVDGPGWCTNYQCYAGREDSRCINKTNGYPLPNNSWCWDDKLNHHCPSKYTSPMLCSPGKCSAYSSAGYEVAGLLIAAIEVPHGVYTDMDLAKYVFTNRSRYPSLVFPPVTHSKRGTGDIRKAKLSDHLTIPGSTYGAGGVQNDIIAEQNPTILGWTCGHMIGSAGDVATFFYDLFDAESEHRIINSTNLKEMSRLSPLTQGWATGMPYGAGLMQLAFTQNRSNQPRTPDQWGWWIGHAGQTYGFASQNGYIPAARAGFSITTNVGNGYYSSRFGCLLNQIAAEVLQGVDAHLNCSAAFASAEFADASQPSKSQGGEMQQILI